jgi:hypothetical protein
MVLLLEGFSQPSDGFADMAKFFFRPIDTRRLGAARKAEIAIPTARAGAVVAEGNCAELGGKYGAKGAPVTTLSAVFPLPVNGQAHRRVLHLLDVSPRLLRFRVGAGIAAANLVEGSIWSAGVLLTEPEDQVARVLETQWREVAAIDAGKDPNNVFSRPNTAALEGHETGAGFPDHSHSRSHQLVMAAAHVECPGRRRPAASRGRAARWEA